MNVKYPLIYIDGKINIAIIEKLGTQNMDEIYEKYNFGLMFGYYFKPPRSEESPHSKAIPCLYMFEKIQELGFQATRWLLTAFLIFVS